MRVRDVVWVVLGRERHPAVVLRAREKEALVVVLSGTGTGPRHHAHEVVRYPGREAFRMGLTKTTYFYETALHVVTVADAQASGRTCSEILTQRLFELAEAALLGLPPDDPRRVAWRSYDLP